MSGSQQRLVEPGSPRLDYTPLTLARSSAPKAVIDRELSTWGLDAEWLGEQSHDTDKQFWRYQYGATYVFVTQKRNGEKEYNPIEFRGYIYTVGQLPEVFQQHFKTDIGRLRTVFDSGPYQGWFPGFNPYDKKTFEENEPVAADEMNNLGVPQFEVRVEKGGSESSAGGFFDPFGLFAAPPDQERLNVVYNPSRDDYEIRPQGGSLARLEGQQKEVYLDGKFIGTTAPSRSSVRLKNEYSSKDGTWKDSGTGKQMWSRRKFIDEDVFAHQAVRDGGQVYKVNETEDVILLRATKPDDFDPTPSERVTPEGDPERLTLDFAEETEFEVRYDRGPLLGKFSTPHFQAESETTNFFLSEPPQ